jgi:YbbR domain-containing protein
MPVQVQIEGQPAIGYSVGTKQITPSLVTVEGPKSKVERISEVRTRISVEAKRDDIQTTADLVPLDANGDVVTEVVLNPSQVTLDIPIKQDANYRDISVIVKRQGSPPPGYYVSGIFVNPQIITVRGDPAVIEAMQPYAETEPIELSDKTDDFRQEVSIVLPPGVTPVQNEKVEVLVTIGAQQGSRTVLDVPIQAQNLGDKLTATFSPNVVDIILSGPLTELDSLNPQQDITVTVDLNGLGPGRHQIESKVEVIYEDIRVDSVLPFVIEVEIKTGTGK